MFDKDLLQQLVNNAKKVLNETNVEDLKKSNDYQAIVQKLEKLLHTQISITNVLKNNLEDKDK